MSSWSSLPLPAADPTDHRWTLLAVAVVVLGLALRLRPILVVLAAAATAAVISHWVLGPTWKVPPLEVFGAAFVKNRVMSLFVVLLPAIGLAERLGLRREAGRLIAKAPGGTPGAVGVAYMVLRFVIGMLGLRVNGHATFVRPIVAPMAESAAGGEALSEASPERQRVKASTAAAENFGNFYGQNLFPAAAGLLLAHGAMESSGHRVGIPEMTRATVPVAVSACVLGVLALSWLDRRVLPRAQSSLRRLVPFLAGAAIGVLLILAWSFLLPVSGAPAATKPTEWHPWFVDFPAGLALASVACSIFLDRRHPSRLASSAFYGLFALTFLLAHPLLVAHPAYAGTLALLLTAIGALELAPRLSPGDPARVEIGWRSLLVVVVPSACAGLFAWVSWLAGLETNSGTLAGISIGGMIAALAALGFSAAAEGGGIERSAGRLLDEGSRLTEAVGAVMILPQLLAAMGEVFKAAGVGEVIGQLAHDYLPVSTKLGGAAVYAVSIAAFTFLMGNSFAAFAVITGGIGIPLLVVGHGADPARVALFGLTAASSGTLVSPMAANFNIVPAALLELRDRYAVMRFQAPVAAGLLLVHIALLTWAT